ncbi:MAG: hypothetical protein RLZZ230_701 [Candidatus Parcubacteria bacterium]|jgi:hypothetical protein
MSKIKTLLLYTPLLITTFNFASHAIPALFTDPEYLELVGSLGFSGSITLYLVYSVFVLDGLVAALLIFGNKLTTNFPWGLLFIWASVWPWVPRGLQYLADVEIEFDVAIFYSIIAVLAYYLATRKGATFFKKV